MFTVVPQVEQFPKVPKNPPIITAIICLKVLMLLHFFVDSGNLFHFEGPKKESEF